MRRMKADVLERLTADSTKLFTIANLATRNLSFISLMLQSARDELVKLVAREGFDKVQIHVLATLTRLKQICCHPAIFAKEKAEIGDSAKYEMLLELLQDLWKANTKRLSLANTHECCKSCEKILSSEAFRSHISMDSEKPLRNRKRV